MHKDLLSFTYLFLSEFLGHAIFFAYKNITIYHKQDGLNTFPPLISMAWNIKLLLHFLFLNLIYIQVLQFIGREDVNQYVVISYTMLVSEKAELEIEVILIIIKFRPKKRTGDLWLKLFSPEEAAFQKFWVHFQNWKKKDLFFRQ